MKCALHSYATASDTSQREGESLLLLDKENVNLLVNRKKILLLVCFEHM